jgi:hypothetical protein
MRMWRWTASKLHNRDYSPGREIEYDDKRSSDEQAAVHEEPRGEEQFLELGNLANGLFRGTIQGDNN